MTTYMHGGETSRNIVNYIENEVQMALDDLDIEMPSTENLSYGNDICDSFGFELRKDYFIQIYIPNCLPEMHDYSEENIGFFGFKNDGYLGSIDEFDEVDYDLKGIIKRIISFIKNFHVITA